MKAASRRSLEKFYERIRVLRERVPARYPVHVRRVRMPWDRVGDCQLVRRPEKHFLIRVSNTLDTLSSTDTLLHEWAHALSWSESHPGLTDHDEVWGIAFSRAYRALFPDEPGS